ncbi:MAG: hypothetical protein AAF997_00345 [Myxococcota bacterium]
MTTVNWRPWAIGAALLLLPVAVLGVRATLPAGEEVTRGASDDEAGETVRAIEHYRRAMRWRFPLNPHPERAARALATLAERLEAEGDVEGALLAWRSVAGSEFATTTLWTSSSERRDTAVAAIVRLSDDRLVPEGGSTRAPSVDAFAPELSRFWAALLLLGFASWACGLWVTASRGFDADGRLRWHDARASFAVAVLGFAVFIAGMLLA